MSYAPPWRRKQLNAKIINKTIRKPRFIGNALGGPDVEENKGTRYSPRSPGAEPTKRILRMTQPGLQPFSNPPLVPTHNLTKIQPKFREQVLKSMRTLRKMEKKQEKQKKQKKRKYTKTKKTKKTKKTLL